MLVIRKIVSLYFLLSILTFYSQTTYLHVEAGNIIHINPQTPVFTNIPVTEITGLYAFQYDSLSSINHFSLLGIRYNRAFQRYRVGAEYNATIDEILFNMGWGIEKRKNIHSAFISLGLYAGPTYVKTDEPYYTNSTYLGFAGRKINIHEFLQFYLYGSLLYSIHIAKRLSINVSLKSQVFLFEEDIGVLGIRSTGILFNYAPLKISPMAGFCIWLG
jgi:hypothetical protein